MASFCANCGSPMGANIAFCPQCGTPAGGRPNPAATPPMPPTAPPMRPVSPGASSALKIVIILVCCLAVGGVAVVGGMIYLAHRVKQAVVQKAAEHGVDWDSIKSAAARRTDAANRPAPKVCELVTKDEISQWIGEPIERAEVQDASCMYYGPAGLYEKLAHRRASGTFKQVQTPGATSGNGMDVATALDQLVNSAGAKAGEVASGGEMPMVMLSVAMDGRAQMKALSATKALFGGIGQAAGEKNLSFGDDIPGLGDKAIWLPKLGLNVLQGETMIRVIPGPVPGANAKSIAIARAVLPRLTHDQ